MPVTQLDYPEAKILIEADAAIEFRANACGKEPWTVQFIESIPPDGVLYDVGANVGSYSMIAAKRGITTVAIEPGFANYAALVRNGMRNDVIEKIIPIPVALADRSSLLWFDYNLDAGGLLSGGASHALGSQRKLWAQRQLMLTTSLDNLIAAFGLPEPTHIKIDVDGNGPVELAVLKGMAGVLVSEALKGLMVEMPLDAEPLIVKTLAEAGWQLTARFDKRGGQKIGNICYGEFGRGAPVQSCEVSNLAPALTAA